VFDEVTKRETGKRAARRGAYVAASAVLQILAVAVLVLITGRTSAPAIPEKVVDVRFIRPTAPPAPPPPAPPAPAARRAPESRQRAEPSRPAVPHLPMVQPREIPPDLQPTVAPDPPAAEAAGDGGTAGVEGGVAGGVAGGQPGAGAVDEAPRHMTTGFQKPREARPGCVRSSMRVPPQLQGFVSGTISVKFAVFKDGSAGQVQVVTPTDPQIAEIVRRGIESCEWIPGTDERGRPTAIWVIMPLRFAGG
jgi:protein TonB